MAAAPASTPPPHPVTPPVQVPVLQATALSRRFGRRDAVAGVNFQLAAGECLALFGPNGAGKTTLLRLAAGLLRPSHGTLRIGGIDVRADPAARAQVGLLSHQTMLYAALTARENVEFFARLHGLAHPRRAADAALDTMQIAGRADVPVRTLSRGLQQRVAIARATVHQPAVLLLDEPYTGLDVEGAMALTRLLRCVRDGGATLVLVTHNVGEGLELATHAVIMRDGVFVQTDERARTPAAFDAARYAERYRELMHVPA